MIMTTDEKIYYMIDANAIQCKAVQTKQLESLADLVLVG